MSPITPDDTIRDMPTMYDVPANFPITGPTGMKIADNWADLLDGQIDRSLEEAGLLPLSTYWWSGSFADGSFDADHGCTTGESVSYVFINGQWERIVEYYPIPGARGKSWSTASSWINNYNYPPDCVGRLLCIAYRPKNQP